MRKISVYAELLGHNYYSYYGSTLPSSINVGYRFACIPEKMNLEFSGGLGVFAETHFSQAPGQPVQYYKSRIYFTPLEVLLQFGRQKNFGELGATYIPAWGEHILRYTGSNGRVVHRTFSQGTQVALKAGYSYYMKNGLRLRVAYTPHFFDRSLRNYQGMSIQKQKWFSFGIGVGYSFK